MKYEIMLKIILTRGIVRINKKLKLGLIFPISNNNNSE